MNEENRSLADEIQAQINALGSLVIGSPEHTEAVETLVKLYKLKLEEDRLVMERLEKDADRENDRNFKKAQMAEAVKDRWFRLGTAGAELLLPLIFYGIWMALGFEFERDGTFTSQTFRNLFSRFRPTKK